MLPLREAHNQSDDMVQSKKGPNRLLPVTTESRRKVESVKEVAGMEGGRHQKCRSRLARKEI